MTFFDKSLPHADPNHDGSAALQVALHHFDRWMQHHALPLWAANGTDPTTAFAERLTFDGRATEPGFRRFRVLARQSAVFSRAARMDPERYEKVSNQGWSTLIDRAWIPGWGWAAQLDDHGSVRDTTLDFYDQAFGLFATACRFEATGEPSLLDHAHECLKLIDIHLRGDGMPGWFSTRGSDLRDQNPHMHYLEALLHLHNLFPTQELAMRIDEILRLFEDRLLCNRVVSVLEHFSADWMPDPARPRQIEPGHQFEWYWLLHHAARQGFRVSDKAMHLFDAAHAIGFDPAIGLYVDRCDANGRPIEPRFRLWPQCEAIKACAVHRCRNAPQLQDHLAQLLTTTTRRFLEPVRPGLWIDRIDDTGAPLVDHVPASSLYHLFETWLALRDMGLDASSQSA